MFFATDLLTALSEVGRALPGATGLYSAPVLVIFSGKRRRDQTATRTVAAGSTIAPISAQARRSVDRPRNKITMIAPGEEAAIVTGETRDLGGSLSMVAVASQTPASMVKGASKLLHQACAEYPPGSGITEFSADLASLAAGLYPAIPDGGHG